MGKALVALLIAIGALYFARLVLIPLALAVTLSFVLTPVVGAVQRLRLGRTPAVLLVTAVLLSVAGFAGSVIGGQTLAVIGELPQYRDNISARLSTLRGPLQGSVRRVIAIFDELDKTISSEARVPNKNAAPMPVQIVTVENGFVYLRTFVLPVIPALEVAGVALIFAMFILINREDLRNRVFRLAGVARLSLMTETLDDAGRRVSKYLLMQLGVNSAFGAIFGVGLFAIGVPAAALWGAVAGLARFIPYVGIILAGGMAIAVSLAVSTSWAVPVGVVILLVGLELITANLIEPSLYGAHTGISPLALLVATTFWTMIWGWAGLILSTPLTVCLSVLGRHVPQFSFLHVLLGDEEVLAPGTQLYQRLLAMDNEEAEEILKGFLAEHSLIECADQLVIPALNLAEQDRHKGKLDEVRENFVFLELRELLAEVEDYPEAPAAARSGRVLCIPANDFADEIVAGLLAQILRHSGLMASESRAGQLRPIMRSGPEAVTAICISAVPPFALAAANVVYDKVRVRFPTARIVLGLWGYTGDLDRTAERFGRHRPHRICTSVEEALQAVLADRVPEEPAPSGAIAT